VVFKQTLLRDRARLPLSGTYTRGLPGRGTIAAIRCGTLTTVLITGGAGFVGANLAVSLRGRHPEWELVAVDNLHRPGSELNLPRLDEAGVAFVEADVRDRARLRRLPAIDVLIECSAEPSALVGMSGDTSYPFDTNLVGAYNCLELARRDSAQFVFLSTSRVYPYTALNRLALRTGTTRFELEADQPVVGAGERGISESFPLDGARTLYGATKLGAELLVTEFAANFGLDTVINRCGVIAGPWQMGRVDQGVFTFWILNHRLGHPLSYIGYGGSGLQVRDLLHVDDLVALIDRQLSDPEHWSGFTGNIGGGIAISLSLMETTEICRRLTGNEVPIEPVFDPRPGDVPLYVSDCSRLFECTDWRPTRDAEHILADTFAWLETHADRVAASLGVGR
jgi:CDP-paratose 2-epimerase